mgnify:CR=1 FL=1
MCKYNTAKSITFSGVPIISRIGLEKRKIESFSDFQKVIESECDYENFEVILKKNRILTEKYLDKAGL